MLPGDRLVCAFVSDREVGNIFRDWPLHITIVPWFRAEVTTEKLAQKLRSGIQNVGSITVDIGPEARFGGRRKLVNLVQAPSPLEDIEKTVRHVLRGEDAWIVDETTKKRSPFRPHVTAQSSDRLHESDSFVCSYIYIIEQKGDCKKVTGRIHL